MKCRGRRSEYVPVQVMVPAGAEVPDMIAKDVDGVTGGRVGRCGDA